ncbi:hypothetical protein HID58_074033 [Brassica napus]|uniref:Replication factor A C-terminal domain-containing protein n=1 Tax=Brassica napus TaxID=3708 RepID=A0ABQ7YIJ7_BRANA|nr:hypothetical protein HID58_074033 [Brassica napus]
MKLSSKPNNDSTCEETGTGFTRGFEQLCSGVTPHKLLSSYAKPKSAQWKLLTAGVTSHVLKCSKKLQRGISSFTCTTCFNAIAVGVVRYCVELLVEAGEDTVVFVAFNSAMSKLTGVSDAEFQGHREQDPRGYQHPQFLEDIVGNTYIFHLKLIEFNFSANHKSFTIARIFDPRESQDLRSQRIPGSAFAAHGGGNNSDDDMHGANCASCKFHVGNSSDGNPPENGDHINDPSDSDETIPNREQEASIIENVDDVAQVSPEGIHSRRVEMHRFLHLDHL